MLTSKQGSKNGGPYTKKQQEERRIQVHHLHFEENKSAVKISELLNVNRNTINEDIRYWYSQLGNEMKAQDLTAKMTKQIQRMEIQRDRLLEELEVVDDIDEKTKLEKFIHHIDNKLVHVFMKMISSGIKNLQPTVKLEDLNEDEIKEFVRDLILSDEGPYSTDIHSENDLKYDLIRRTKCDLNHTTNVIEKMKQDGLELCQQSSHYNLLTRDYSQQYDLGKFAILRGYITSDESAKISKKRFDLKEQIELEEKEREEKFIAKFGPDKSKWSKDIKELFYYTSEDP